MPGAWTEPSVNATATGRTVARGGSRYVRVPADWPAGAEVRLLLLAADATPTTGSQPPGPLRMVPGDAEAPR